MMTRPTWDEYFMQIAYTAATRSTCPRRSVGAVLVQDRHVISIGYNGAPRGSQHCTDIGCLIEEGTDRCIRTIHAEQNAILFAGFDKCAGTTLYTTCRPCTICARIVAGSGIVKVIHAGDSPDGWNKEVLENAGIEIVRIDS